MEAESYSFAHTLFKAQTNPLGQETWTFGGKYFLLFRGEIRKTLWTLIPETGARNLNSRLSWRHG